jgi:hypothetical protein
MIVDVFAFERSQSTVNSSPLVEQRRNTGDVSKRGGNYDEDLGVVNHVQKLFNEVIIWRSEVSEENNDGEYKDEPVGDKGVSSVHAEETCPQGRM